MADTKQVLKVINKIIAQLSELTDEELQNILEGSAKFIYEAKKVRKPKKSDVSISSPDMETWKTALYSCSSVAEGIQYLKSLERELTVKRLKEFADYLGCRIPSGIRKESAMGWLVDHTLGINLNRTAIHSA